MKFFGRRDNKKETVGKSPESHIRIGPDQRLTHKKIDSYLRGLNKKEIAQRIQEGSPRLSQTDRDSMNVDFVEDYKEWREYARRLQEASTVIVAGHQDGLGDSVHHIRYSIAIALEYPDKKIFHLTRNPELFDEEQLPPNVELAPTSPREVLIDAAETSDDMFVFNPSLYQPILDWQFGGSESQCVMAETHRGREGYDLFSAWYYSAIRANEQENQQVREMRKNANEKLYYTEATHQLIDQKTKLEFLLGVSSFQEEVPMREPQLVSNPADVVIIMDAAEGGGKKLASPLQWAEYVVRIIKEKPDATVSLVRGINNPQLVEEVLKAVHKALENLSESGKTDFVLAEKILRMLSENIFSGSLVDLYDHALAAQVVASVDTGPGHMVNEAIRTYGDAMKVPKLISLFGTSPFNPLYYRLDCGDSFIGNGSVKEIDFQEPAQVSIDAL